ncbi:ABC transporter permease [bacterium]|nr:ABC transporter permease [bacterium]
MFSEYMRISLDTLNSHRFRTALTLLAIILGSFSIVLMTSLAESGLATMISGVDKLGGQRMILIIPKSPERAKEKAFYSKGLTRLDAQLLRERLPYTERVSAMKSIGPQEMKVFGPDKVLRADALGADRDFLGTFAMQLKQGRAFTIDDFRQQRRVIILGDELARDLFGRYDPLDKQVFLFNRPYRVIGTLERNYKLGISMGFEWNRFGLVPEPTLTEREGLVSPLEMMVVTQHESSNDIVKRVLNNLLIRSHNRIDDFEILDFHTLMSQFDYILTMIKMIVAFISSIALVIGGVGIMNIMLVSVNERTREIGIRRAVGAPPRSIMHQFLIEACLLTLAGSLIGILLAIGLKILADWLITGFILPPWTGVLSIGSLVYALAAALTVGLVFGFFPARRAALLNIDRCLRVERG